jgi:hypothetical protein
MTSSGAESLTGDGADPTHESLARKQQVCFGFAVQSDMEFSALREGEGSPLTIVQGDGWQGREDLPLFEWTEADQPYARLWVNDSTYDLWIDQAGWFRVDPLVPSIAINEFTRGLRLEARLWGLPAILCYIHRGDFPIHAACVEVNGSAVLIAAPGRYGKTTLASAFLGLGGRVLSEDVSCCRLDSAPAVLPGPALLRMRRDVYERLEFPHTHVSAEDPERIYLAIDEAVRGTGAPVPLRAVILLRKSDERLRMERVPAEKTVPDLWTLSFSLPTDADRARRFRGVTALGSRVPVWNLYRRLSFDHLSEVVDTIVSTCLP